MLTFFVFTDSITRSEMEKRETELEELTGRYTTECEMRRAVEQERDNLTTELVHTCTYISLIDFSPLYVTYTDRYNRPFGG